MLVSCNRMFCTDTSFYFVKMLLKCEVHCCDNCTCRCVCDVFCSYCLYFLLLVGLFKNKLTELCRKTGEYSFVS